MKNISKIISTVFLSFSILLLCYVFYQSHVIYGGIKFEYYLQYYIIAFLLIILSLISFFIPKKLKIKITIVIVTTIIGLYIIEGYLVINSLIIENKIISLESIKKYKQDYDKRTKFEIYNDLKKEDPTIVIVIYPYKFINDKNLDYLPLSGISNRKTIHCNENGYYSIYQSDRYGFNNPDEEWDKNEIEFFLVGDQFTIGSCVNEPDTISANLRKLNNNKNGVLNLGHIDNGPLMKYATLREYFPSKKVNRVLWFYNDSDIRAFAIELNGKILVNYLNDKNFSQNLILRKQEIQKLLLKELEQEVLARENVFFESKAFLEGNGLDGYLDHNKLIKLLKFVRLDSIRGITFSTITSVQKMALKKILKLSNEFTKQNNSKLYFVYLPAKYHNFMNHKTVTQIVESLNIPIIDINKELLKKHKDPLSLYPFRNRNRAYHFNEEGYRLVAETIFTKINELER